MKPSLTIVIPAYNEEHSLSEYLPQVLDFCEKNGFKLIVVDDGSKDGTYGVIQRFTHPLLKVLRHKVNRGYGGAIKSGILASDTDFVITIDADGQHYLEDVLRLYEEMIMHDADMVVGRRLEKNVQSTYRRVGKFIIRTIAKMLMKLPVHDINSGMKLYNATLAKNYLSLCPDSMAYSDIITLVFINQKHLVIEKEINVKPRKTGKSTISIKTAFDTLLEIMHIVVLFNPMKIFLTISVLFIIAGLAWGVPIMLLGRGVSVGTLFALITGVLFFLLGLIAEQLSMLRKKQIMR